jgi:branched-chain amino acid transport system ATP-binding protein
MLALARALSRGPTVLLADELSLGLAPRIVDALLDAVRTAADNGLAVLLVEQHVAKVMDIADYVYVMQRGEVVLEGTQREMQTRLPEVYGNYVAGRA